MRTLAFLLAMALLTAQPCTAAQTPLQTFYSGASRVILPLRRAPDGKLFLTATVQGQPATLLLDTGGSQFLDLAVARRLGLDLADATEPGYGLSGGPVAVKLAQVDLKLGDLSVTGLPVSCIDLGPLRDLHLRQGIPVFDGILGSELLATLRARVDYEKLTLELRRPTPPAPPRRCAEEIGDHESARQISA